MCQRPTMIAVLTGILICHLILPVISLGQDSSSCSKEVAGMGYCLMGQSIIDLNNVNSALAKNGYSELSDNFFSVGGGGHAIMNQRLILGGEGHTLLGDDVITGNYKSSIHMTYGCFNIGYILYSIKGLNIYPLLGIGGGTMNLKITEEVSSLSWNDLLNDPKRGAELSTGGLILNIGLGVDYFIKLEETDKEKGGFVLGLRAGYSYSPFKGELMMNDMKIIGAPEMGITGPYIRFMLGGGGYETRIE